MLCKIFFMYKAWVYKQMSLKILMKQKESCVLEYKQLNTTHRRYKRLKAVYNHLETKSPIYSTACGILGAIAGTFAGKYYSPDMTCSLYEFFGSVLGCIAGFGGTAITLQELKEDIESDLGKLEKHLTDHQFFG